MHTSDLRDSSLQPFILLVGEGGTHPYDMKQQKSVEPPRRFSARSVDIQRGEKPRDLTQSRDCAVEGLRASGLASTLMLCSLLPKMVLQ